MWAGGRRHGSREQWANLIGTKNCRRARWEMILNCGSFSRRLFLPGAHPLFSSCRERTRRVASIISFFLGRVDHMQQLTVLADVALLRKTSWDPGRSSHLYRPGDPPHSFCSAKYLAWNRERKKNAGGSGVRAPSATAAGWASPIETHATTKKCPTWKIYTEIIWVCPCASAADALRDLLWKRQFFPAGVWKESAYVWTRAQTRSLSPPRTAICVRGKKICYKSSVTPKNNSFLDWLAFANADVYGLKIIK